MMSKTTFLFLLSSIYFNSVDTAKILAVFPTPSISHQVVFRKLTEELVRRGHHVTVITTDPVYPLGKAPANLKEVDIHDVSYKIWTECLENTKAGNENDLFNQVDNIIRVFQELLKAHMEIKEFKDIIDKKYGEYDLLLLEAWVRPILIFSHIFKVPVISVGSMSPMDYHLRAVGAPVHPILYPSLLHQKLYNLTTWEKLHELYKHVWFDIYLEQIKNEDDEVLKDLFGPDTPSINELYNNIHMMFFYAYPIWLENPPVPTSVVYIGGIHIPPPKELPKDLNDYLDSSKNGVIYFSLGTNFRPSLLPPQKIQIFINVFSQLPYDVMWKWDQDELLGRAKNIKIFKFLPQSDILQHQNVKLFITQGGLQSTDEAINAGVPLIGIPLLGDQWFNVEKYVHHKIGLRLDFASLTESKLKDAILTAIGDKSYRENIERLRSIVNDQPQSPLERAIWWTEHVLRHGGAKHLRAAGANITWTEYLELDLVLIVVLIVLIVFTFVSFIVVYFCKYLFKIYGATNKIKIN